MTLPGNAVVYARMLLGAALAKCPLRKTHKEILIMIYGIWLAVLGILGASSLIIAKKPDAKELIAKLTPFQGWIGAVSAIGGVWIIISSVLNIGWMTTFPI